MGTADEDSPRGSRRDDGGNVRRIRLVDRLYRDHASNLTGWLRRRYGDGPLEPEDVTQAAFSQIAGLESLDHIQNLRAFVYTIAANLAVSNIRTGARTRRLVESELSFSGVDAENLTPERVYEAKERLAHVSQAFSELPERQQDIVIRCRLLGQTYSQISEQTGWSLGTIAADVKSAMLALASAGNEE